MTYVYCLAWDLGPLERPCRGLDGATVEVVKVARVSAVVSEVGPGGPVADAGRAQTHHRVVQGAWGSSASVLPCRFGTVFPDVGALQVLMKRDYRRFRAALSRVRGKAEVGVRVLLEGRRPGSAGEKDARGDGAELPPGAQYLLAKRDRVRVARELRVRARRVSRELDEAMAPFWSEVEAHERAAGDGLLLTLSYLVERAKLPSFQGAYRAFQRRRPGLKLLWSGPWPPYSFAEFLLSSPAAGGAPD